MIKAGLAVSGSFCTFGAVLAAVDDLAAHGFDLTPVFSFNVSSLDTRFFKAADFEELIRQKTGKTPIKTIPEAEPIGTSAGLELMLVAPCTGNTLAKIAHGITDTPVTMAVKAQLGGESTAKKRPSRRAVHLLQRRPRRQRQKLGAALEHTQRVLRPLLAGRSGKETQLPHRGHEPHKRGVSCRPGRQTTPARAALNGRVPPWKADNSSPCCSERARGHMRGSAAPPRPATAWRLKIIHFSCCDAPAARRRHSRPQHDKCIACEKISLRPFHRIVCRIFVRYGCAKRRKGSLCAGHILSRSGMPDRSNTDRILRPPKFRRAIP